MQGTYDKEKIVKKTKKYSDQVVKDQKGKKWERKDTKRQPVEVYN